VGGARLDSLHRRAPVQASPPGEVNSFGFAAGQGKVVTFCPESKCTHRVDPRITHGSDRITRDVFRMTGDDERITHDDDSITHGDRPITRGDPMNKLGNDRCSPDHVN
jgi:hypothetical protein